MSRTVNSIAFMDNDIITTTVTFTLVHFLDTFDPFLETQLNHFSLHMHLSQLNQLVFLGNDVIFGVKSKVTWPQYLPSCTCF